MAIGSTTYNDALLENQISTHVAEVAEQEVRQELATAGMRLRVQEAELAAYRDQLDEGFREARAQLSSERSACESEIALAQARATRSIQGELETFAAERDSALAAVHDVRAAEARSCSSR